MTVARVFQSLLVLAAVMAALLAAGCDDSPTAPSNYAPFAQLDLFVGSGDEAVNGRTLTVHYTGWFYDETKADRRGVQFDTSQGRGPFTYVLGAGQVISGWERGVPGMKAGGVRRLVIPPSLAYGNSRTGPIPPNATLVFDIELVSVQ